MCVKDRREECGEDLVSEYIVLHSMRERLAASINRDGFNSLPYPEKIDMRLQVSLLTELMSVMESRCRRSGEWEEVSCLLQLEE